MVYHTLASKAKLFISTFHNGHLGLIAISLEFIAAMINRIKEEVLIEFTQALLTSTLLVSCYDRFYWLLYMTTTSAQCKTLGTRLIQKVLLLFVTCAVLVVVLNIWAVAFKYDFDRRWASSRCSGC